MQIRIILYILVILLGAVLLIGIASQSSADIDERTQNAIYTAYMNGYVAALRLDIELITQFKENEKMMKKYVQNAARKYIAIVNEMN